MKRSECSKQSAQLEIHVSLSSTQWESVYTIRRSVTEFFNIPIFQYSAIILYKYPKHLPRRSTNLYTLHAGEAPPT